MTSSSPVFGVQNDLMSNDGSAYDANDALMTLFAPMTANLYIALDDWFSFTLHLVY